VLIANTSASAGQVKVTLLFDEGTAPVSRVFPVGAQNRLTILVPAAFPEAAGKRFGTITESVGPTTLDLVVDQSIYWIRSVSGGLRDRARRARRSTNRQGRSRPLHLPDGGQIFSHGGPTL
jgi:hypothetical protein